MKAAVSRVHQNQALLFVSKANSKASHRNHTMTQTIEKPENEESEFRELTIDQLQAVLTEHFGSRVSIQPASNGDEPDDVVVRLRRSLYDGNAPTACVLSDVLKSFASKFLAAANRIDELAGYSEVPEFYVRNACEYKVAVSGLDDDFDIDIFNAKDDEDAIRQAREVVSFLTNGKPVRKKPENAGPVRLQAVNTTEFRFQIAGGKFDEVEIIALNKRSESQALAEATAFIEWLQAQSSPAGIDHQPELKIA